MDKRPALGKGLSALIPDEPELRTTPTEVDIDRLSPNQLQPRVSVDDAKLEELTRSIASHGIIQPIVVRKVGDRFQIIAGERRWRAARHAGLMRVPVVVKQVAAGRDQSLLEMALIENIQRENLNPIDEALAYRRLADEFQLKQEDIAAAVGKDRASVANYLRLLKLPDEVRNEVASGRLSMGHARALLALPSEADVLRVARDVLARNLSVRETESMVRKIAEGAESRAPAEPLPADVHTRAAAVCARSRTVASPSDRSTSLRVAATSSARVPNAARRFSSIWRYTSARAARVFASNSSIAACARARDVSASSRADPIAFSRAFMMRVTGRSRSRSSTTDSTSTKAITHTTDKSGSTQRLFSTRDKQQFIPFADEPRQVGGAQPLSVICS